MSEYQVVAFRAVDGPVSAANLQYMQKQSSRAEITPWSFDNEYDYGDFHGNAVEMLRRGYDVHLHYANFGIRKLLIRLPHGLPDAEAARPYFGKDSLEFLQDKQGSGGTLAIEPSYEPGELEELYEFDEILNRLIPLRAEVLNGDLRPLYLAHLAVNCDENHDPEETHEAPVPAGLNDLSDAQWALAELYELSDALIAAAAKGSPPAATQIDVSEQQAAWIRSRPEATKDAWLVEWVADPSSRVRAEILSEWRKATSASSWPTVRRNRTIAELQSAAIEARREMDANAAGTAALKRAKRLADIASDPSQALRETEQLVKQRNSAAYGKIAKLLTEVRDALAGSNQSQLAEQHAQMLVKNNPTLRILVTELRRQGFIPKR